MPLIAGRDEAGTAPNVYHQHEIVKRTAFPLSSRIVDICLLHHHVGLMVMPSGTEGTQSTRREKLAGERIVVADGARGTKWIRGAKGRIRPA